MSAMRPGTIGLLLVPLLLLLAGCTGNNLSVVNNQNQFSIAWQVNAHTEAKSFAWKNDQAYARISFSSQVSSGTLTFEMLDQGATKVCTAEFTTASDTTGVAGTTVAGQPGNWRINFQLRQMTGNVAASIEATDMRPENTQIECL